MGTQRTRDARPLHSCDRTLARLGTISIVLLLMTLASAPSPAQNTRDSRVTKLWLAFLPNDRNLNGSDPTLHIMIAAEGPASGNVRATSRSGSVTNIPVTIAQATDVVTLQLVPDLYE